MKLPYTYISCPCTEVSAQESSNLESGADDDEEQEKTFDPRSPRANFSLYPPEHLLYCEECQQIRCSRCIIEEIVCWYCPSCLFEMPITMVRSEGGRCPRNCFNCPICTAPLSTSSLNPDPNTRAITGPFILNCGYCKWSSLDIGWHFEKLSNIQAQIARMSMETGPNASTSSKTSGGITSEETATGNESDVRFSQLRSFYSSQLSKPNNVDPLLSPSGALDYTSPASLQRILSIYAPESRKKGSSKNELMRESANGLEGLRTVSPDNDSRIVRRLHIEGWNSTANPEQRSRQKHPSSVRFTSQLRPTPNFLRTKRNKRCRICRHILVKPEPKVANARFRIRLLALNYIPTISIIPLQPAPSLSSSQQQAEHSLDIQCLPVLRANQFLLTLKNPLFDSVNVTLATPPQTPGRYGHKVTILCPEFSIGPNIDQWDEALSEGRSKRSSRVMLGPAAAKPEYVGGETGRIAEAGKVWEKGRNWTSVVLEVVCVPIEAEQKARLPDLPTAIDTSNNDSDIDSDSDSNEGEESADEDILEIPIFMRMEWEGDTTAGEGKEGAKTESGKEKRELAFWTVIGVGRIERRG